MTFLSALTLLSVVLAAGPLIVGAEPNVWTSLGPDGGQISALVIHPLEPETLYAATNAGIFKSTDGATSWKAANSGLATLSVRHLVIDPLDPRTLYTATDVAGIYKSTDGGASWNPINSGLPALPDGTYTGMVSLAIVPQDPTTLYAAICCRPYPMGSGNTVFKTTDRGQSWSEVSLGSSISITLLVADPKSQGTVYAAGAGFPGLFKTTNAGASWTGLNAWPCCVGALAIDPQNSNILYAGVCCANPVSGIVKSTDGGANWAAMSAGIPTNTSLGYTSVTVLTIDPQNPRVLYAATTNGLFKSTDAAATWSRIDTGLPAWIPAFAADPNSPATLYAGTGNGLFKSTDGAGHWSAASSGLKSNVWDIDPDPTNHATLYAISQNQTRITKSVDGGANWTAADSGLPGNAISVLAIDSLNSSTVYAGVFGGGTNTGGVFKSTDGGTNWKRFAVPRGGGVEGVSMDPQVPDTLYAWNSQGLYKTVNGATSWDVIGPVNFRSVLALVVDPHDSGSIYSISSDGVVKSADGGANWVSVNSGLPTESGVRSLAFDPRNSKTLYAWNAGYDPAGPRLFKTMDGGMSWKAANFGLLGNFVTSLAIDPRNASILYAASRGYNASGVPVSAVFRSADAGSHWSPLNPALANQLSIYRLVIDPQDTSRLYAATSGGAFAITIVPTPTGN